jgi:hypothetical protein
MAQTKYSDIADAIRNTLISPNECDRNLESANVVDALFFVGRQIRLLAICTRPELFDEKGDFHPDKARERDNGFVA